MAEPLLLCQDVGVRFGGLQALSGVEFKAAPGEITAIIGPNGAGKTTLLNAISGMVQAQRGTFRLGADDITRAQAHERSRLGLVRTFQNLEIFSNMTVLENVMTGCHSRFRVPAWSSLLRTRHSRAQEKAILNAALEVLDFVGLFELAKYRASDLPFGKQRLLELARALASGPRLLLLDEPAAGLNMSETQVLADLILRVREHFRLGIVLVEHDMDLVMRISDQVMVLCFGQVISCGTPAQVQRDPHVISAYLGDDED
ncbi:MAG: ABC transporter ATP-binding protein [Humidesulfovibrio sp.]|uniref:ABC transporter ATP-binding protein n=1 Tax=Humidesulfovibrio sp. TaxID=2910988 RepID=UPI0027EEF83A|nr:ABC transporter ATP-binding protein [Humidesulfovibrio sp.]MDQ7834727.1 ABC transporter ATP-binding protein [Humidesulfovibrio sp.]